MERLIILGLGETVKQYEPQSNDVTFGVNDVFKYHAVQNLVCVNTVSCFSKERQNVIFSSTPDKFYTIKFNTMQWENKNVKLSRWKEGYNSIEYINYTGLSKGTNGIKYNADIEKDIIYSSRSSPFMAVQIAIKANPEIKNVYLYGVDFSTHKVINGRRLDLELICWKWLLKEYRKKGYIFHIPKQSKLSET